MNDMNITSPQYKQNADGVNVSVQAVIDGETLLVAMDTANRHYAEILRQVDAGTLTIQDAD